ncbi:MAG TPA: hypothetical protein VNW25_00080 [Candidatus Sulfotelmatobacter sp.]|nr:hypothetical protein [Candidatus Sulfotelmatobacter sp.]
MVLRLTATTSKGDWHELVLTSEPEGYTVNLADQADSFGVNDMRVAASSAVRVRGKHG